MQVEWSKTAITANTGNAQAGFRATNVFPECISKLIPGETCAPSATTERDLPPEQTPADSPDQNPQKGFLRMLSKVI